MAAINTKRNLIDKSNSRIVIVTAAAAFVIVFSLVASKALFSQDMYNSKVITKKKAALEQLNTNINETQKLVSSYKAFVGTPTNLLGGNPSGTGPKDGTNAKLILDALPSQYDFPALASSLENIGSGEGVQIVSITGSDDEVAQQANLGGAAPTPVAMPFTVAVKGTYEQTQSFISKLEHSIRPFQVLKIDLTASDQNSLTTSFTGQTYYLPAKTVSITKETVK